VRESRKPIDSEPKPMPSDKPQSVPLQPVVLHPCPFCGAVGHAVSVESFTDQRGVELWIVHCGGCLCDGPMALSPDGAATVWNVRFAIMQNPKSTSTVVEQKGR